MAKPLLVVRAVNSALRFGLELAALYGLGRFGYSLGGTVFTKLVWLVALSGGMVLVWGAFIAPKARITPPVVVRLGLELLVFGAASYAFASLEGARFGWWFLGVSTLSSWVNAATAPRMG